MKDKLNLVFYFLKKTWLILLVIVIVAVAGITSIEIYREEVLNIDPNVEYKTSGTLYLSCEPLDTLNPLLSQSEDVYHLSKLIYNSLFDYDDNLNVVPELVDEYTVDTNRGKITLTLKEGIRWHNGKKLTASDVSYTVNAIKYAGNDSLYYETAGKISYVYVRDTYKLEIYFRNAYDASLDDLTFPILPASQFSSAAQLALAEDGFKPVGTGQYQYQSYNYLKQLRLKPNEEYWAAVASKKLKVMILPEKELSSNMLEIDSVTCYVDTTAERRSTVIDKNLIMYDIITNDVEFLIFHPKSKILSEKKMRHAVALSIHEQGVLDNGYMGDGVLTDTIYYPGFCGVADEGTYYTYNADAAAELFKELGYKDRNGDNIREDKTGKNLEISIAVNKKNATRLAAARLIKKDLETAGLKVTLDELTWDEYKRAITAGKHDIIVAGFSINEQYDLREFFNGKNQWKYCNNELLSLAGEMERLHTTEEYKQIYAELKAALMEELPYYSLCYRKAGLVGVSGFSAGKTPLFNDYYRNIETWSWTYIVEQEPVEGQGTEKNTDSAPKDTGAEETGAEETGAEE